MHQTLPRIVASALVIAYLGLATLSSFFPGRTLQFVGLFPHALTIQLLQGVGSLLWLVVACLNCLQVQMAYMVVHACSRLGG